jgi:hypothetical protein
MRSPGFVLLLLLVGWSVTGCMTGETRRAGDARTKDPVQVQVINENFLDMTIYAVGDGPRVRLGDVVGKNSSVFTIRPRQVSMAMGLQLFADPIGSTQTFLSEKVYPDRYGQVVFEIAPVLDLSTVRIR